MRYCNIFKRCYRSFVDFGIELDRKILFMQAARFIFARGFANV